LALIYRISKFSALSGVSLDWLTVTRNKPPRKKPSGNTTREED
jgi:hypothetical protein